MGLETRDFTSGRTVKLQFGVVLLEKELWQKQVVMKYGKAVLGSL